MGGEERLWGQREGKMNGIEMQDVKATKNKLKVKKNPPSYPCFNYPDLHIKQWIAKG